MSLPRAVLSNTLVQAAGKVITSLLGLLTTAFLTRYFGTTGFGQYSLVFTYLALISILPDFGLFPLIIREINLGRANQRYLNNIFSFRAILGLATLLIFDLLIFLFPYPAAVKFGVLVGSLGAFFLLLQSLLAAVFQARLQMQKAVLAQVIASLFITILTLWGISLHFSLLKLIFIVSLGNLLFFFLSFRFLGERPTFTFEGEIFKKIFRQAWPLAISVILGVVYFRIDTIILSLFFNPEIKPDVGIYSAAYRIFEVTIVFGTFFTNSLFPVLAKSIKDYSSFPAVYRQSLLYSLLLGMTILTLGTFLARFLILIVGGEEFLAAIVPLQILFLAAALSLFSGLWGALIVSLERQKFLIWIGLGGVLVNLTLNLIFIPRFSYLAAAWVTVITGTTVTFLSFFFFRLALKKWKKPI